MRSRWGRRRSQSARRSWSAGPGTYRPWRAQRVLECARGRTPRIARSDGHPGAAGDLHAFDKSHSKRIGAQLHTIVANPLVLVWVVERRSTIRGELQVGRVHARGVPLRVLALVDVEREIVAAAQARCILPREPPQDGAGERDREQELHHRARTMGKEERRREGRLAKDRGPLYTRRIHATRKCQARGQKTH